MTTMCYDRVHGGITDHYLFYDRSLTSLPKPPIHHFPTQRAADLDSIIKSAEQDLRDLLSIPDNYKVMFLQGGASTQFAMIPMNLMKNKVADYIITGQWAKKAYQEAALYGKANAIASSADETFSYIPDCSDLPISEDQKIIKRHREMRLLSTVQDLVDHQNCHHQINIMRTEHKTNFKD